MLKGVDEWKRLREKVGRSPAAGRPERFWCRDDDLVANFPRFDAPIGVLLHRRAMEADAWVVLKQILACVNDMRGAACVTSPEAFGIGFRTSGGGA